MYNRGLICRVGLSDTYLNQQTTVLEAIGVTIHIDTLKNTECSTCTDQISQQTLYRRSGRHDALALALVTLASSTGSPSCQDNVCLLAHHSRQSSSDLSTNRTTTIILAAITRLFFFQLQYNIINHLPTVSLYSTCLVTRA